MEQLRLRPMTAAEFKSYRARAIRVRAADHVQAGDCDPGQAETLAAGEADDLLPAGLQTVGMLLLVAEAGNGEQVGQVWIALNGSRPYNAWVYDLQISPERRGEGYGRALLQATEEQARRHGATVIGARVSSANTVIRSLLESSGWNVTLVMRKPLDGAGREN